MIPLNIHATAVVMGDYGVIITGPSGAGKTTLALALVDRLGMTGQFARIVCDDQLFLEACNGRLIGRAPETIAGLVEIRGAGPQPVPSEPAAVFDLLVRLVPAGAVERMPDEQTEVLAGIRIRRVDVAEANVVSALPVVLAHLK